MQSKKDNEYSITCNYDNSEKEFKSILQNYIKYLIKIPVGDWNLQKYELNMNDR